MLPVDVVFRNLQRSDAVDARIRAKADDLAVVDPRLQRCRVVVDLPHRRHKHGDRFRVRIELSAPGGRDLLIEHGPVPDVHQAIHDAFETARRRLRRTSNAVAARSRRTQRTARPSARPSS